MEKVLQDNEATIQSFETLKNIYIPLSTPPASGSHGQSAQKGPSI
jgi:hypothetical protein